jgi:hypothetical protein
MWQWKDDDESRIVPKLTYVKRFAPWDWILGTGVYIEDVDAEVARCHQRSAAPRRWLILLVVALLLFVLLYGPASMSERGRLGGHATALRAPRRAKYRSLVESAAESIFMQVAGEGLFANASMLHLVGYERRPNSSGPRRSSDSGAPTPAEEQAAGSHALAGGDASRLRSSHSLRGRADLRATARTVRVHARAVADRRCRGAPASWPSPRGSRSRASSISRVRARRARSRRPTDAWASMASLMVNHGAPAMQVSRLMNQNAELVVRRSLELAMQELGAPPAPFELLLMGSIGRSEPSLWADQDHAILYPDGLTDEDEARRYYLELGSKLSDLLDAAGYAYCPGGIMASEPECCRSLSGWKERFGSWIHALSPEDLLQVEIFFDFRAVHGSGTMAEELWRWLFQELRSEARFLPMLAHAVLQVEPPLTSLGGFVVDGDSETGTLNLKGVIAQYVGFARLRALQHGIEDTSTAGRLRRLAEAGQIRAETARETTEHFEFLMQLRMRHQAERLLAQLEPDNRIAPAQLEARERELLAAAFRHLKALQGVLAQEFTGGRS